MRPAGAAVFVNRSEVTLNATGLFVGRCQDFSLGNNAIVGNPVPGPGRSSFRALAHDASVALSPRIRGSYFHVGDLINPHFAGATLLLLLGAGSSNAAEFVTYVSGTGNDTNACTKPSPCRTVQAPTTDHTRRRDHHSERAPMAASAFSIQSLSRYRWRRAQRHVWSNHPRRRRDGGVLSDLQIETERSPILYFSGAKFALQNCLLRSKSASEHGPGSSPTPRARSPFRTARLQRQCGLRVQPQPPDCHCLP